MGVHRQSTSGQSDASIRRARYTCVHMRCASVCVKLVHNVCIFQRCCRQAVGCSCPFRKHRLQNCSNSDTTTTSVPVRYEGDHFLLGLPFIHASSVSLPATSLIPTSKGFVSKDTRGGRLVGFSTLYHITKTVHLTLTEW